MQSIMQANPQGEAEKDELNSSTPEILFSSLIWECDKN